MPATTTRELPTYSEAGSADCPDNNSTLSDLDNSQLVSAQASISKSRGWR